MNEYTSESTTNSPSYIMEGTAQELLPYKIGKAIHKYYFPAIAVVGLLGNIISLCILLQPKNRRYPCYRTLTALSFSDIVIIISSIYIYSIMYMDEMTEVHCKIWTYTFQAAALSSALLVVFVTTHKYLAFLSPFKSHRWRSTKRTLKIIIVVVFVSLCYSVVHVFGNNLLNEDNLCTCIGISDQTLYDRILSWIALGLHALLPVTFVIIMNSLIIRALHKSNKFCQSSSIRNRSHLRPWRKSQQSIQSFQQLSPLANTKDHTIEFRPAGPPKNPMRHYDKPTASYHKQSAVLLIAVTCAFAVLTPPLYLFHIVYNFVDYKSSPEAYAINTLVYYICLDLFITNSCINFFLYMAAGTKFRQDVKKLFIGRKDSTFKYVSSSLKYNSSTTPRESPNLSRNSLNVVNAIGDKSTKRFESTT